MIQIKAVARQPPNDGSKATRGGDIPDTERKGGNARRLAAKAYPFRCCSWCGTTHGLTVAHLDGQRGNDAPDNLAWLCGHCHHGLLDKGLILPKYVRGSRDHWQKTRGVPVHMNALKAVATMKRKGSLSANAKKAWATRRARTATGDDVNVVGVMEEF